MSATHPKGALTELLASTVYPNCKHGVLRFRSNKPWLNHEYVTDGLGRDWCRHCLDEGKLAAHTGLGSKRSHLSVRAEGYGLKEEELKSLLAKHDFTCHICKNYLLNYCVDHDHSCCPSGIGAFTSDQPRGCGTCVRGILCSSCNSKLRYPEDTYEKFSSIVNPTEWEMVATQYLKNYETERSLGHPEHNYS